MENLTDFLLYYQQSKAVTFQLILQKSKVSLPY